MYDLELLCLIKAGVNLYCEVIVSHDFNIEFKWKIIGADTRGRADL